MQSYLASKGVQHWHLEAHDKMQHMLKDTASEFTVQSANSGPARLTMPAGALHVQSLTTNKVRTQLSPNMQLDSFDSCLNRNLHLFQHLSRPRLDTPLSQVILVVLIQAETAELALLNLSLGLMVVIALGRPRSNQGCT